MAAVIREIFTENPYFASMRRGSASREEEAAAYDPAYQSTPQASAGRANTQTRSTYHNEQYGSRSSTSNSISNERGRYTSQQHFDPRTQSSHYQQGSIQPMPNHYESTHLAGPSAANNSTIPRSAYSSNDLTRYASSNAAKPAPVINVRDLAHIESFAAEQMESGSLEREGHLSPKYEISAMPIADVIEMVAALLTKITTTNDRQHEHLHRPLPHTADSSNSVASGNIRNSGGDQLDGLTQSVLAFHGKNVPSITVLSYLSRIHKYCPLTYEVFLSLLVYFDRMTERVNPSSFDDHNDDRAGSERGIGNSQWREGVANEGPHEEPRTPISLSQGSSMEDVRHGQITPPEDEAARREQAELDLHNYFVVDSFNIHRLVIAGVTCASKFFSDTFYTNSRYAKVCSSPQFILGLCANSNSGRRSTTPRT